MQPMEEDTHSDKPRQPNNGARHISECLRDAINRMIAEVESKNVKQDPKHASEN